MAAVTSVNHFIPTLLEKRNDGVRAFAFCPLCDKVENSNEYQRGEQRALAASVAKIRKHMQVRHRLK